MENLKFADKVRLRLAQLGITKAELANRAGMTRQTLNFILQNGKVGKTTNLLALCRTLKLSSDYLLDDEMSESRTEETTEEQVLRLARSIGPDKALRLLLDIAAVDKDRFSHNWGGGRLPSANNHDGGKD